MKCHTVVIATILLLSIGAGPVVAQHHHAPAPDSLGDAARTFVREAREATERYRSLDAAIAAGYRLVGPDMPGMGEHWVHPRRAMTRTADPVRPAVLTYLRVAGEPVLTGVAFTAPVLPGEEPPPAPVDGGAWHYHTGTIEDQLTGGHAPAGEESVRLAMMHAWIWVDNPAGVFAPDNWALSFARLGRPVPDVATPAAARALFLLSGGVDYYAERAAAAGLGTASVAAVRHVLEVHRRRVGTLPEDASAEALEAVWQDLWRDVRRTLGDDDWQRVSPLAD